MSQRALKIVFAFAATLLTAQAALAQSTTCANLNADLAALDKRAPVYDPYGDAVIKQRSAIDRAQADFQRYCSGGLFSQPSPNCPTMAERIQAMQANLGKLQKIAPQVSAKSGDANRQRLMGLLRQNHCGDPGSGVITTFDRPQPGALATPALRGGDPNVAPVAFGRTFTLPGPNGPMLYREESGGRIVALGPASMQSDPTQRQRKSAIISTPPVDEDDPRPDNATTDDDTQGDLSGTYRTLCVRTCDGYYFPISYAASRNQFGNDADVCRARCPGTDTQLFVVKTPGEDGQQSVSADGTGQPYTKLPNALRYRSEVVKGCACGRPDPTLLPMTALPQEDLNRDGSLNVRDVRAGLPVPDARPLLGEDPETLADLDADFLPHPVMPPATPVAAAVPDGSPGKAPPRTIRVVGPKFFDDR